jgi:riboflavin kinase/FMN adenylyltransferase
MVICKNLEEVKQFSNSVVTIGSFDGLHKGHKSVIRQVLSFANKKSVPSVVISFDPHPKTVLNPAFHEKQQLISTEKKLEILQQEGIDYVWLIPFDFSFAQITAGTFLKEYLIKYFNPLDIIIGYDHHFGKNKEGNSQFLLSCQKEYGYDLHVIEPISVNESTISSTGIRHLLKEGKIEDANAMLGKEYELKGVVVKGAQLGKKLDFPTANINIDSETQLVPKIGVYCVDAEVDGQRYQGMCNIGKRPTFYDNGGLTIEVHIFGENTYQLYNKSIILHFKQFIREEKKYTSADELISQLNLDRQVCLSL